MNEQVDYRKEMYNQNATPNELTPVINQHNVTTVEEMIELKMRNDPFYGNSLSATSALTDMDHHPYSRFWRGSYLSSNPIVIEREAGWRPNNDRCYKLTRERSDPLYPKHCFETACSTVYPCYPEYMKKISDREAMALQLNKTCVSHYR